MIGRMLGNRYEVLEKLGGGGMAIVYKGRDTFLKREVTIKVMRPEFTSDEDFVQRFRREAQAVARLSHANIVNIHDVGQEDGIYYLVMEYVRGDNLKNIIKQKGRLEPEEAVHIAVQVCEALEHAHNNNIVHRDIKPHNILITADGKAKLTDFGIAMETTAGTITRTDTIMGSVHYLSPEQARGETATARSDIYAVGILLYEMLTGKQPYSGDSPIAIALKHIQETPLPVNEVNPSVPAELAEVIGRAMEKKPELRYRSARELARRLEAVIDDTGQNTVIIPIGGGIEGIDETGRDYDYNSGQAGRTIAKQKVVEDGIPRTWKWIAILALITGLITGGVYSFYKFMDVPSIKVPKVVGLTEEKARAELESLGLKVEVLEEFSQEEKGIVIHQDYGPEDPEVKPGRVITITVSKGPDLRTVPGLTGLTLSEAQAELVQKGLTLDQQPSEEYHPNAAIGTIIGQYPAAGEKAVAGSAVKVVLSKGPEPKEMVMPDLRGRTLNEAEAMLTGMNLVIDRISWDESTEYLRGQIIHQVPSPGMVVTEGAKIKVVVNSGPGPVERHARVTIKDGIPDDGKTHTVEIIVEDMEGRKVQYEGNHTAGETIREKITYLGSGKVQILVDGQLIKEEPLD